MDTRIKKNNWFPRIYPGNKKLNKMSKSTHPKNYTKTIHPKNYRLNLLSTTEKIWAKVINPLTKFLTNHEIEILKLGTCFTLTPKHNISELHTDNHNFIRKLRLIYHFRGSTYENKSILKNASTFTPKANENQELETICKNLS